MICDRCGIYVESEVYPLHCACGHITHCSTGEPSERTARIQSRAAATRRLISWLRFLRHPEDTGIGDTAHRLNMRSCKSPDAHAALSRLLKQCNCKTVDAVSRLNDQYPH